uniref:Protein Spindly-like n=1 Tax=Phallusia mammillata TaxID=59560 RepID=A0A6F9DU78_9ASCI|nr:protein Spindly-like [Phallusia mammillata]
MTQSESNIEKLQKIIEEKDRDLQRSALHGKSLLETNKHLEELLDKLQSDYDKLADEYEQSKHSTGLKLEIYEKAEHRHEVILAEIKESLKVQHEKEFEAMNKKHEVEITDLKSKNREMRDEIDERMLTIHQKSNRIDLLENRISELECKVIYSEPTTPVKSSDEVASLTAENQHLSYCLKSLTQEYDDYKQSNTMQNNSLQKAVEGLQTEKHQLMQQCSEHHVALQDCQEQVRDLRDELELVRLESHDPNSKGNSLFGEVEDRRKQAEKQYISAKVKLEGMERKYKNQVNYSIQLKTQLMHLQLGGSEIDKEQISKLQSALGEARSDVKTLVDKVGDLECKLSQKNISDLSQLVDGTDKDNHVVELLQLVVKEKETALAKYKSECSQCRLDLIMETRRGDNAEGRTYDAKRHNQHLRNKIAKLELENTSLRLKYGEDVEGKQGIRIRNVEKLDENTQSKENLDTNSQKTQKKKNVFRPSLWIPIYPRKRSYQSIMTHQMLPYLTRNVRKSVNSNKFRVCVYLQLPDTYYTQVTLLNRSYLPFHST